MPTATRQCGGASKKFYCPSPRCIADAPQPTAPKKSRGALQQFHCPLPEGNVAVHCKSSTVQGPMRCGSPLQKFHSPLTTGNVAVYCGNSTARCPQTVWPCIARVPRATALKQ